MTAGVAQRALDVPARRAQGRARSWWTGWRLALRMARRDVRRDRGRSWFVWLMIAVPVALIAASQVLIASTSISAREWTELHTGGNQARITWTGQAFTPELTSYGVVPADAPLGEARPVPGWGNSIPAKEDAVTRLVGGPATAITSTEATFGTTATPVSLLGLDARASAAAGMIRLTAGRLPATGDEALVTVNGALAGLPDSGDVTVGLSGKPVALTIVGRAEITFGERPALVTLPRPDGGELGFLISGDRPITYEDAVRLARYGFTTVSRDVVTHRPVPSDGPELEPGDVAAIGGLIEVTLLVGPAFAIGAARQRRSLALAATNGATPRQLRRVALGQALLLGTSAAAVGTMLGTAAGVALWPALSSDPTWIHGPLEVPVAQLVLLPVLGSLTALGAALVTSRGLGRLALVAALQGTARSAPPRRGVPIAGALLLASGIAAAWLSVRFGPNSNTLIGIVWMAGGLAALAGALLATPALLRLLGRLGGGAPVAARMALRDLARQRGRATATVAAVLGGVMMLTAVWTIADSTQAFEARGYVPYALDGQGIIETSDGSDAGLMGIEAAVASVDPDLRTTRFAGAAVAKPGSDGDLLTLAAMRKDCTVTEMLDPSDSRCRSMIAGPNDGILVGSPRDLSRVFRLDAAQADALAHGRLLVNTDPFRNYDGMAVNELAGGTIGLASIDLIDVLAKPRLADVPALAVGTQLIERGAPASRYSVLASIRTASELGWQTQGWRVLVSDPNGPISAGTAARIDTALERAGLRISVERGFVPTPQPIMWLIAGTLALLAVIGSAMSTILATTELRPFLATFDAVGAPPTLIRRLATIQAAALALLATVLGSALGMALGAPMAMLATEGGAGDSIIALPWLVAGVFVVGVPVTAGAVAAVSTSPTRIAAR